MLEVGCHAGNLAGEPRGPAEMEGAPAQPDQNAKEDEDHHPDAGYDYIYSEIEVQCSSDFDIEHVKVAFNSPKNTTVETLDDSDPYDDVYFYSAEFSSAIVARSICQAYTKYTQLSLG